MKFYRNVIVACRNTPIIFTFNTIEAFKSSTLLKLNSVSQIAALVYYAIGHLPRCCCFRFCWLIEIIHLNAHPCWWKNIRNFVLFSLSLDFLVNGEVWLVFLNHNPVWRTLNLAIKTVYALRYNTALGYVPMRVYYTRFSFLDKFNFLLWTHKYISSVIYFLLWSIFRNRNLYRSTSIAPTSCNYTVCEFPWRSFHDACMMFSELILLDFLLSFFRFSILILFELRFIL